MSVRRRGMMINNGVPPTHNNAPAINDKNHVINLVSTSGGLPEVAYYDLKLYSDDYPSWTMFFYSDVTNNYKVESFFLDLRKEDENWKLRQGICTQSFTITDAKYATISLKYFYNNDTTQAGTVDGTVWRRGNTWKKEWQSTTSNRPYAIKREDDKIYWGYWDGTDVVWNLFINNGMVDDAYKNLIFLKVGGNNIASDGKCEFQLWLDNNVDLTDYFNKY